ncbi:MAG TPA: putative quinol monooxygenase [Caulobacteraceae bacterium]
MSSSDNASRISANIVVAGYIRVAPADRDNFIKVLQRHVPQVLEKDGCIAYSFSADFLDPNVVRVSELWRDLRSLEAHLASEEFLSTGNELREVEFLERSVQRYDVTPGNQHLNHLRTSVSNGRSVTPYQMGQPSSA